MRKMFLVTLVVLALAAIYTGPVAAQYPENCPTYCHCGCDYTWAMPSCNTPCQADCTSACSQAYSDCIASAWTPEEVADCAAERSACRASCGA